jgi:hypothetical protein
MYVKKKFVRRGDKVYGPFWQVVRSRRIDGKPRQEVVANVGRAETREEADKLARAKGLLCGVGGCGEAATVEPEHRGFRPTYTLMLPGGRKRELLYLLYPAHAEAWKRTERLKAMPLIPDLMPDIKA